MTDKHDLMAERIDALIGKHGSMRAAARVLKIDHAYLWKLRNGQKDNPCKRLLKALGLKRVVIFEDCP